MALVTHPRTGLLTYTAVIVCTHLTGFMDLMTLHLWLITGENILYIGTGYLFLLPLLGREPVHQNSPLIVQLPLLLLAMVPDPLVGIVLLQGDRDPSPAMMESHPAWAPPAMSDTHLAGGPMWAGGDGLMMAVAMGLALSVNTSPAHREQVTGPWLDAARGRTLADRCGVAEDLDPDSDAALDAYNLMLQRLDTPAVGQHHER